MKRTAIFAAILAALTTFASQAWAADESSIQRVNALLQAYSKKDSDAVLNMLDPKAAMYGTAKSEFYTTPSGIQSLLRADYRHWDSSSFGSPLNVTVQTSGNLQSVFFEAPFTAVYANGERHTYILRFATVWHHVGGHWLLVQSMNAVAT